MSLPKEYVDELNLLNKEVMSKQPTDVLQFCANFFQLRLEQERTKLLASSSSSSVASPDPAAPAAGFFGRRAAARKSAESVDPSIPEEAQGGVFSAFKTALFKGQSAHTDSPHDTTEPANAAGGNGLFHHSFGGGSSAGHFPVNFNANRRISVSAESLNPKNLGAVTAELPGGNLTPEQLERLNKSVGKNFLFTNLDEEALKSVLSHLKEKKVTAGTVVIKQGDVGDFFYIVEEGTLEFLVDGQNVGEAGPGSSFGELALMYNAPRAATVRATSDAVLWALDRLTFRSISLGKTFTKRKLHGEFLKEVPILKGLNSYELSKLANAMNSEVYEAGDAVITEGAVGEQFYIIESGEAEVTKKNEGKVQDLSKGGYFGEVALLNDLPRQATVTAKSKLRVVTLDKGAFQRLLGPVVDILKRQDPTQH